MRRTMTQTPTPTRLICAITSPSPEAMCADIERAARAGADAVECRIDLLDRPPTLDDLRAMVRAAAGRVEVIVTNRPVRQGGRFEGDESQRLAALAAAVEEDVARAERDDAAPGSDATTQA